MAYTSRHAHSNSAAEGAREEEVACPVVVEEEGSLGSLDGIYPWQCVDTRV